MHDTLRNREDDRIASTRKSASIAVARRADDGRLVAAKTDEANRKLVTRIVRERRSNFLNTDFI